MARPNHYHFYCNPNLENIMSNERQKQVRIIYDNFRPDSIFGPYRTKEDAEDMASNAATYAHVVDVVIEPYEAV